MTRERAIALTGIFVICLLLSAFTFGRYVVPPGEVVKEAANEAFEETQEVGVEVEVVEAAPMTMSPLAETLQQEDFGMAPDQRYHKIHAAELGLECATCHAPELRPREVVFFHQDVSPKAPGPVDRRSCLGCHRAVGPGPLLYGAK